MPLLPFNQPHDHRTPAGACTGLSNGPRPIRFDELSKRLLIAMKLDDPFQRSASTWISLQDLDKSIYRSPFSRQRVVTEYDTGIRKWRQHDNQDPAGSREPGRVSMTHVVTPWIAGSQPGTDAFLTVIPGPAAEKSAGSNRPLARENRSATHSARLN